MDTPQVNCTLCPPLLLPLDSTAAAGIPKNACNASATVSVTSAERRHTGVEGVERDADNGDDAEIHNDSSPL